MKKFIALLRGINVSGQKKIRMSELQLLFEELGFRDVETYIQSGNVIFSANEKSNENIEKLYRFDYLPEEYVIDGRYVYLFVPNGYGRAKLNNNYFENKLRVLGTTRNWKTVVALSNLLKPN